MDFALLHPVQKDILLNILRSERPLNYAKLLPIEMKLESDRFNYHLQYLVKEGLIEKAEDGYLLTLFGTKSLAKVTALGYFEATSRMSLALVLFRFEKGVRQVLLHKRLRHPFYGDYSFIAGKIKRGELIEEAAKRKLLEESGLNSDFKFVGVLRKIRYNDKGNLIDDTSHHYCVATEYSGNLLEKNEYGENSWHDINTAVELMMNGFDDGEEDEAIFKSISEGELSRFYIEQKRTIGGDKWV
jgi:ADP-ribose pyrophosphatase YjhB (NUDIX family)/predicted transcriptional regulator